MKIQVLGLTHEPTETAAVIWGGTSAEALLLAKEGWITGADMGYNRDGSGDAVLRANVITRVGVALAFPGDAILKDKAFHVVLTPEELTEEWLPEGETPAVLINLDDEKEDVPPPVSVPTGTQTNQYVDPPQGNPGLADGPQIPDGNNPDAVDLEPDNSAVQADAEKISEQVKSEDDPDEDPLDEDDDLGDEDDEDKDVEKEEDETV